VATWLLVGRPSSVLARLILNLRPLTDGDDGIDDSVGRHGFIIVLK
jgi:hypothetical protein